jgi:hypothetical protein
MVSTFSFFGLILLIEKYLKEVKHSYLHVKYRKQEFINRFLYRLLMCICSRADRVTAEVQSIFCTRRRNGRVMRRNKERIRTN